MTDCDKELLEACEKGLEWINNIMSLAEVYLTHGELDILARMPNNFGGRIQMQKAIDKARERR